MRRPTRSPLALALALALVPAAGQAVDGTAGPYLAARQALTAQDFAAAVEYLDALGEIPGVDPGLIEDAVVAHMALGDLDAAAVGAQRLADMGLASRAGTMVQLVHLLRAGAYPAALAALSGREGTPIDPLLRGWTRIAKGSMSEALADFDALAGEAALRDFALYHKALALAFAGDVEGAEAILSGAAEGPIRLTRRGILARAQVLALLERPDEALELIEAGFGPDPDPEAAALRDALAAGAPQPFDIVGSARDGMAEVFFDIASGLRGDTDDAFVLLLARLALSLRPEHVQATLLAAGLLDAMGQHGLAGEVYGTVPPEAPLFHLAEIGRAEALARAGAADEAIEVLRALADSHGHLALVHVNLGDMLRRERQFDAASRAYDRAIEMLGTPQPEHWVVWYTRAITHEREDRWPQAEADFRKALELNPDQPHVLNYLGYSLVERRENLDEALDMIERAVAGEPDNGYIVDSLGWVFYRLGRYDEALVHMERAVELLPTDAVLNDHLGDVFWALGRKREARFQWRRALSFGPADDLDMDRIRRKLDIGLDAVLIEEGAEPHHADAGSHGN